MGINITAGNTLGATTVVNNAGAAIANAGTITRTGGTTNAGTLNTNTATRVINGGQTNTGTTFAAGQVDGAIQNNGTGTFNVTRAQLADTVPGVLLMNVPEL